MQQLDSLASANSSFSAALQKFEALTAAEQLPILAFMLRYEIGRIGVAKSPARARQEPAAAPMIDTPSTRSADSKVVVTQPPESQRGATEVRELAAAAKIQFLEAALLGPYGEIQSSSGAEVDNARGDRAAPRSAANVQTLSIATTMIISFALTFGTMLWQRRSGESATREPEMWATAPAAASTRAGPVMQAFNRVEDRQSSIPSMGTSPARREAAGEMPVKSAAPPLPVDATFRRIPRGQGKVEGGLANMSSELLEVTALVRGRESGTQAPLQLSIAAGSSQLIGVEDGLELRPGDEVRLQSANYRDLVIEVQ